VICIFAEEVILAQPTSAPPLTRRTYKIEEVAQLLGISMPTAYRAATDDHLPVPVIRVGRRYLVSRAALNEFLGIEENAPQAPASA
jgi:excisionase family DNA binding protein